MKTLATMGIGVPRLFFFNTARCGFDTLQTMEQSAFIRGIRVLAVVVPQSGFVFPLSGAVVLVYGCTPGLYFLTVAASTSAGVNATRFISPFANIAA